MTKSINPSASITDVIKPNESAPSATSIPVIVNNRPILRDPMMSADVPVVGKPVEEASKLSSVTTKINIQPVTTEDTKIEVSEVPKPKEESPAPDKETEPDLPEIAESSSEGATSPQDVEAKVAKESEDAAKQDAELQGLVDSKKYFLPINTVQKRRTKRFVTVGVGITILLALIWVNIALDAGLIHIGELKALTHIFST